MVPKVQYVSDVACACPFLHICAFVHACIQPYYQSWLAVVVMCQGLSPYVVAAWVITILIISSSLHQPPQAGTMSGLPKPGCVCLIHYKYIQLH